MNFFLHLIAFTAGAAVMILEVLGAHVLSPCFGSSFYVWTALISTTLAALALGYAVGGRIADRAPRLDLLCGILALSSLPVLLMPAWAGPVLDLSAGLGLKAGALLASILLVLPPLVLLSTATPFVLKLRLGSIEKTGTVSGSVIAVSTAGSIAGTLLAGFLLLPSVGTYPSLFGLGVLLVAVAAAGFLLRRKWKTAAAVAAAGAFLAFLVDPEPAPVHIPAGMKILHSSESHYGRVDVLEDETGTRYLLVDGICQTRMANDAQIFARPGMLLSSGASLEVLPFLFPRGERALFLGLGGGFMPTYFRQVYGWDVKGVEIDPEIARIAARFFGYEDPLVVADGRTYLRSSRETFDFIIVDAYRSEGIPPHLFTLQAFEEAKALLSPQGLFAVSHVGGPATRSAAALWDTLSAGFPHVRAYACDIEEIPSTTFVAGSEPFAWKMSSQRERELGLDRYGPLEIRGGTAPKPLRDGFAPLALWRAEEALTWRSRTRAHFMEQRAR